MYFGYIPLEVSSIVLPRQDTVIRFLKFYLWKPYGHLIHCSHGFVYIRIGLHVEIQIVCKDMDILKHLITFMFR